VFFFQAREVPGIKIFHYCGGLNFATRNHFKTEFYRLVGINPRKELVRKNKIERSRAQSLAKIHPEEARVRKEGN
jgi:solute carrier family 26 protein